MPTKPKFKPVITMIKLNPEQAVLACSCYGRGRAYTGRSWSRRSTVCYRNTRRTNYCSNYSNLAVS